jgi:ABC-2 type transport system ATP-binding protein
MADRPRHVLVRAERSRTLAAALLDVDSVAGVSIEGDDITVATRRAGELAVALPSVARRVGARLREVRPLDDSLESIFRELVR